MRRLKSTVRFYTSNSGRLLFRLAIRSYATGSLKVKIVEAYIDSAVFRRLPQRYKEMVFYRACRFIDRIKASVHNAEDPL